MRHRLLNRGFFAIALALIVGAGFTAILYWMAYEWEAVHRDAEFSLKAEDRAESLARTLDAGLSTLHSIRGLFDASQEVERGEFSAFVHDAFVRHPQIHALWWVPRVRHRDREAFVESARRTGLAGYQISGLDPAGRSVTRANAENYFPILYSEPGGWEDRLLGFDLASIPAVRETLDEAVATGQATATARMALLSTNHKAAGGDGVIAFLAIYTKHRPVDTLAQRIQHLEGVVAASFRFRDLAGLAWRETADVDMVSYVFDEDGAAGTILLARGIESGDDPPGLHSFDEAQVRSESIWSSSIPFARRRWALFCVPKPAYFAAQQHWYSITVLLGGILFTALFVGYVANALRHATLAERTVTIRTGELRREIAERQRTEDHLRSLLAVSRAFVASQSPRETSTSVLRTISETFGWSLGALWSLDESNQTLRCVEVWNPAGSRHREFEDLSRRTRFSKGRGLPGRVWASRQSAWIPDVTRDTNFPRGPVANQVGLHAAFGVPICVGERFLGVMEFFSPEIRPPDTALLDLMDVFGGQIGLFLERRIADEALQESEERYRDLFENASDLIQSVAPDGRILFVNRAWLETLGFQESAIQNLNVKDLLHPDSRASFLDALRRVMAGERVDKVEATFVARTGRGIPLEGTMNGRFVNGRPAYARGIFRDRTEQQRVERMKADFLSTVSHELRTPLTAIRGALGLIAGGATGELPASMRTMLQIAHRNSARLVKLISDILDAERIESGRLAFSFAAHELQPLIDQVVETNRPLAELQGVRFEIVERLPQARVWVDADRLAQVATNLLSNAAKFSPSGTAVQIRLATNAGRLRVTVTDFGPGVPEEFRPHVFDKFVQADTSDSRHKSGTGLGLAIARSLIERMGGSIGFESGSLPGTSFWFDLPALPETARETRDPAWVPEETFPAKERAVASREVRE